MKLSAFEWFISFWITYKVTRYIYNLYEEPDDLKMIKGNLEDLTLLEIISMAAALITIIAFIRKL